LVISIEDFPQSFLAISSDPAVTEWLLIIFKFNQFQQVVPNFISWEVFGVDGTLRLSFKGKPFHLFLPNDNIF